MAKAPVYEGLIDQINTNSYKEYKYFCKLIIKKIFLVHISVRACLLSPNAPYRQGFDKGWKYAVEQRCSSVDIKLGI